MKIDGPTLLQEAFHKFNVHSWGMFGTLIGYIILFRSVQYLLFAYQTGSIKLFSSSSPSSETQKSNLAYQPVAMQEKKQPGQSLEVESGGSNV